MREIFSAINASFLNFPPRNQRTFCEYARNAPPMDNMRDNFQKKQEPPPTSIQHVMRSPYKHVMGVDDVQNRPSSIYLPFDFKFISTKFLMLRSFVALPIYICPVSASQVLLNCPLTSGSKTICFLFLIHQAQCQSSVTQNSNAE